MKDPKTALANLRDQDMLTLRPGRCQPQNGSTGPVFFLKSVNANHPPARSEPPRRRRLQFSIAGLLMLMVVGSVMAAAGSYLVRSLQRPAGINRLVFVLFTLLAPVALLIAVSLIRRAAQSLRSAGRK